MRKVFVVAATVFAVAVPAAPAVAPATAARYWGKQDASNVAALVDRSSWS